MKLMIDCMPLSKGGGVQVTLAFLTHLVRDKSVNWLCVAPEALRKHITAAVGPSHRIQYIPKSDFLSKIKAGFALRKLEEGFSPDIVFTVFGPAYFTARAPHVVGFALPDLIYPPPQHLPYGHSLKSELDRMTRLLLLKQADHFMVETSIVAERLAKRLNIGNDRISVVGNTLNPVLQRMVTLEIERKPPFVVLTPSAYYSHKNLEIIPKVAAQLRMASPNVGFEFRLTLPRETPHWRAISDIASSLGVTDMVKTLGVLDLEALGEAYRSSHFVLLPTLREASTAVYPESFHFERPLITSDEDFSRLLCGDAALFVPALDSLALAEAVILLSTDGSLCDELVSRGTQRLKVFYPTPAEKYSQQMSVLRAMVSLSNSR